MKDKIVVIDTNVLLHDPEAPHRFGDLRVVIPMQVVEEIDRFKKDHSEKGRNARRISRLLDSYRARGSLADGVPIEGRNYCPYDYVQIVEMFEAESNSTGKVFDTLCGTHRDRLTSAEAGFLWFYESYNLDYIRL